MHFTTLYDVSISLSWGYLRSVTSIKSFANSLCHEETLAEYQFKLQSSTTNIDMNLLAQAIGTPIVINKNSISIDAFEVAGVREGFKIWWGQILKSTKNLGKSFKSSEWLKLQMEFQSKLNIFFEKFTTPNCQTK